MKKEFIAIFVRYIISEIKSGRVKATEEEIISSISKYLKFVEAGDLSIRDKVDEKSMTVIDRLLFECLEGNILKYIDGDEFEPKSEIDRWFLSKIDAGFTTYDADEFLYSIYTGLRNDIKIISIIFPISIDSKTKHSIRKEVSKLEGAYYTKFRVDNEILGGVQIFIDGQLQDYSWINKINSLNLLTKI